MFAFRSALALALCGHALFLLGLAGQLRPLPIAVAIVVAILVVIVVSSGGQAPSPVRTGEAPVLHCIPLIIVGLALLPAALRSPWAFDETLYHLPLVRALAHAGHVQFWPNLRFPAFPQLEELLCVPAFLIGGDVATHLLPLIEVVLAVALLFAWDHRYGTLAAALFLGSPIVVQLATIGYVEAALMLFIIAGFYCLDREWYAFSGFFFGTACAVKYLGGYFAVAALILVLFRSRSGTLKFAACCVAAALPTTLWLVVTTGNPVFPFFGSSAWSMPLPHASFEPLRAVWDVTFARSRVNFQPPYTPFLIVMVIVVIARARSVALIAAGYLIVFAFLPKDSRYLVPLLPLLSIATARNWPDAPKWVAAIAVAPGALYLAYMLAVHPVRNPEVEALFHADEGTVYVCGAEQLKAYARGELLGDFNGPYAYDRIIARDTSTTAANLRRIPAKWFLVSKRACAPPIRNGGMDLVYEDAAAQLWRVQPSNPHLR
jgi:hypothetical protein